MRRSVLLLCVAACGAHQHPRDATTGRRVVVHVEGNQHVDSDTLTDGLILSRAVETGQPFDPYLVSTDQDRLRGYYLRRGYFDVHVASRIDEKPGEVDVTFTIDEGPRAILKGVDIDGLPPDVPVSDIRDQIALADGAPFDYTPYDVAKPHLLQALERDGYAHARLQASVAADKARHEAVIHLQFDPGPRSFFGPVILRGVDGPLADAARDRLRAHEGDRYSTTALEDSQAALYDMQRFAVVRVEPDRTGRDPVVPVLIRVTPSDRHELRLGGGFGLDPSSGDVHTRAGYAITDWPAPLLTTRLELRPAVVLVYDHDQAEPRLEASASVERIDFLRPMLTAEAATTLQYIAVEAYTSVGPRLELSLKSPLGTSRLQARVGWQLQALQFTNLDPAIDPMEASLLGLNDGWYRLGFFEQSLVADGRDDPVEPKLGAYGELRAEEGTRFAGGAFDFVRLTPEVRGYVTPIGPVTFAAKARAGAIVGDLPVTERYFAGGADSQRGFPERRLAPFVSRMVDGQLRTTPIGGGALAETSLEARAPIGRLFGLDWGGVTFLDGGDVTERWSDLDLGNLQWAAGAGVRIATVIGPARLDVGYRLNRTSMEDPYGGHHWAFHLSLGEAF